MQFKTTFVVLAAMLATVASGMPSAMAVPGPALEDLKAREAEADGHIYICTEANFTGECTNLAFNAAQCINFPGDFQDSISSMGPDRGWICTTFVNANCDYNWITYVTQYPGFSSLPPGVDNALSSVVCVRG